MTPLSSCAIGHSRDRTVRPAVFADEAVGVRQHFSAGGGVERSAFGVLDARIGIERGLFGAARVLDALGAGQRVNVFVIKIEVARKAIRASRLREFRRTDLRNMIFASSSADFNMRSMPAAEKSLE